MEWTSKQLESCSITKKDFVMQTTETMRRMPHLTVDWMSYETCLLRQNTIIRRSWRVSGLRGQFHSHRNKKRYPVSIRSPLLGRSGGCLSYSLRLMEVHWRIRCRGLGSRGSLLDHSNSLPHSGRPPPCYSQGPISRKSRLLD